MGRKKKDKTKNTNRGKIQIIIFFGLFFLALAIYRFFSVYDMIYDENVVLTEPESSFYISSGSSYESVRLQLFSSGILKDTAAFSWVARKKNYPSHIKGGHYILHNGMNNNELINMLRGGFQTPVQLTFHHIRTLEQLAGTIGNQIEPDSSHLLELMRNETYLNPLGFKPHTVYAMFIPNTYEVYWNMSAEDFMQRMRTEYKKFWNNKRESQLEKLGMSKIDVSTLASIVDEETYINDEIPTIAGVYINRLNKGIRLQADPTIKFALNDFTVKRVLRKHLEIDSPYNTYKNSGLPPGPIAIPSIAAIDGVLEYKEHSYIYFCAKADFSGRHEFSKTLTQHLRYARQYQQALNRQRIYR